MSKQFFQLRDNFLASEPEFVERAARAQMLYLQPCLRFGLFFGHGVPIGLPVEFAFYVGGFGVCSSHTFNLFDSRLKSITFSRLSQLLPSPWSGKTFRSGRYSTR